MPYRVPKIGTGTLEDPYRPAGTGPGAILEGTAWVAYDEGATMVIFAPELAADKRAALLNETGISEVESMGGDVTMGVNGDVRVF
jgi:hypothetical protein